MAHHLDSFDSHGTVRVGDRTLHVHRLAAVTKGDVATLPFSLKVLLEALLRTEDGVAVRASDIEALAAWDPRTRSDVEIQFLPARVLLQDFTGVPCVVDLAALREAFQATGGDPARINPLLPVDLVIDHSVQVDAFGSPGALAENTRIEMERNRERYAFLRWGQQAFHDFRAVPPGTGIVHQVNLEHLAQVVFVRRSTSGKEIAYPDSVLGTDSHTTMVNGLGVLGWGVGGIEAEAAMLGQPSAMLIPEVVGLELVGELPAGATATDAVLTVTELLRKKGVVGKFVELFGDGLDQLALADRATIANMAPEYGATMGYFPVDAETLAYLRLSGRDEAHVKAVEAYCKEQGLFRTRETPRPRFSDTVRLDLSSVEPSLAGPKRPQDRVPLRTAKRAWRRSLVGFLGDGAATASRPAVDAWLGEGGHAPTPTTADLGALAKSVHVDAGGSAYDLGHGSVVIAAITSCTNTSNPGVMLAAGLLARKAVQRGLRVKPWVKTSLAPGSKVVTEYLRAAGVMPSLEALGFHLVGYGCTTCIGNSGPLPHPVATAVKDGGLVACAVLSGNRNFEGRVNPLVRANYLASPPLVVAYAIAGRLDFDPETEPLGTGADGRPVLLKDVWPTAQEVRDALGSSVHADMFRRVYADVLTGAPEWRALPVPEGQTFAWDPASTYVRRPPFFEHGAGAPRPIADIRGARVLVMLGDSVTTDHISPAGSIAADSPAGRYLQERGVKPKDFNSYGSRRGNHEVMVRGTFANIRLRNELAPGVEGGVTRHLPGGEPMTIHDAAMRYEAEGVPLLVIAGKEYGSGSSRDWAAKGPALLGVRAVIAESFERIHRSNLVGLGVIPLELVGGQTRQSLGLTGEELYDVEGLAAGPRPRQELVMRACAGTTTRTFTVRSRVDTPREVEYLEAGGILPFVLRQVAAGT